MRIYNLLIGFSKFSDNECKSGRFLSAKDGLFIDPLDVNSLGKEVGYYALTDSIVVPITRYNMRYEWSVAKSHCEFTWLIDRYGYLSEIGDLRMLYGSVTSGNMRKDLEIAGIYDQCNYASRTQYSSKSWGSVWSNTFFSKRTPSYLNYDGIISGSDPDTLASVIPFFKF